MQIRFRKSGKIVKEQWSLLQEASEEPSSI